KINALSYLREESGALVCGAMTRQRDLEFSDLVKSRYPLLHEAIMNVGHRQTRNRGTVGGSLCHLDPSAEIPTVAAAVGATVSVTGPKGNRDIPFAEFSAGFMSPAIDADELVVGVRFPAWPKGHGYGFVEFARRHGDFAITSAAALLEEDANGKIKRVSLTIGGVTTAPPRMRKVERALVGQTASEGLFKDACEESREIEKAIA